MIDWLVYLSKRAETDLDQIYEYIAITLLEPEIASKQISRIRDAIIKLDHFPERCPLFGREPWRSQGLRHLVIDNYLAVFTVDEERKSVIILTIVYAKRNLQDLL